MNKKIILSIIIIITCGILQNRYLIEHNKYVGNKILANIDGVLLHASHFDFILKNNYIPQILNLTCIALLISIWAKNILRKTK